MLEVMKTMLTPFKRSHACPATLSVPNPGAGHHQPTSPVETPGHSWACLGRLLWGHCPFLLGPGAHKILFVPSKSLFPQSCVSSGGSMVGLMATSTKRAYAIPRSAAPRAPAVLVDINLWLKLYTLIISQFLRVRNFHSISQGFNPGASWGWGLI